MMVEVVADAVIEVQGRSREEEKGDEKGLRAFVSF